MRGRGPRPWSGHWERHGGPIASGAIEFDLFRFWPPASTRGYQPQFSTPVRARTNMDTGTVGRQRTQLSGDCARRPRKALGARGRAIRPTRDEFSLQLKVHQCLSWPTVRSGRRGLDLFE